MKKVFFLAIISLILVTPNIVFAEGEYCADENLRDYRQELGNIDYEYVIDYDDVKNVDKDGYPVDYINISVTGLPDKYMAIITDSNDEIYPISLAPAKVSGGVLKVDFYYIECSGDLIKEEEIFLPYYNKGELNPFNDGSIITSKKAASSLLITIVLSFIVVILFIVSIFVIKKGRKS